MQNKYHLRVYKVSTVVTGEFFNGANVSIQMKEIWEAPFKDETSILNAAIDFTGRGFYCQIVSVS